MAILIALLATAPVIATGTWAYLHFRRWKISLQMRVGIAWGFLAFISINGFVAVLTWYRYEGEWITRELGWFIFLWLIAITINVVKLRRLRRQRDVLNDLRPR